MQISLAGLIWALPVLPLLGAAVAVVLPAADRLTLRMVAMVTCLVVVAVLGVCVQVAWPGLVGTGVDAVAAIAALPTLRLSPTVLPAVLATTIVVPVALRAGAPRVQDETMAYVVALLALEASTLLALLLDDVRLATAAASVAAVPCFALVALFGGPERGTVTWRAAALWLVVDGAGLAALAVCSNGHHGVADSVVVVAALGPGLVRLAAGVHGLWALPVLEMAPVAAAACTIGASAPLGAVLLWRATRMLGPWSASALADVLPAFAVVLCLAAAVAAALLAGERDLRRLVGHYNGLLGAIVALALLAAGVDGTPVALAMLLSATAGVAGCGVLAVIEAVERRIETRKVHELAGLSSTAPLLAALLPLLLLLLAGLPGPGTATTLWPLLVDLLKSPTAGVGVAALWCVGAVLLGAVGTTAVAARVALPSTRKYTLNIRVSFWQGVRLVVPLAVLMAMVLAQRPLLALAAAVAR